MMAALKGKLDKNTPMPLYHQVKELIREQITNGNLRPGDCIPPEMEIMEQFGISRNTVRQAVGDLVNDGYLYRLKSKGTFVSEPQIDFSYMTTVEPFQRQIEKAGKKAFTQVLELGTITDPEIASELKMESDAEIIKLLRVRGAGTEPIVIVESYLPYDLCAFIMKEDLESTSLYELLGMREDTRVDHVRRTVEAVVSQGRDSRRLQIHDGFPLQSFLNYAYTGSGRIVEYCISKYKGNRNKFTITVYNNNSNKNGG